MLEVIYFTILAALIVAEGCLLYGEHTKNHIAINIAEIIFIAAAGAAIIGVEVWVISGL